MRTCTENFQDPRARIAGCLGLAFLFSAILPVSAAADQFVGAVWSFEMIPHNRNLAPLTGRYRISDHVMFQRENPLDIEYSKYIGSNYPNGNRTQFEVSGLRVFNERGQLVGTRNGVGRVRLVTYGRWAGIFIDGLGRTYEFSCSRLIE